MLELLDYGGFCLGLLGTDLLILTPPFDIDRLAINHKAPVRQLLFLLTLLFLSHTLPLPLALNSINHLFYRIHSLALYYSYFGLLWVLT